jgi:hypothetical protein
MICNKKLIPNQRYLFHVTPFLIQNAHFVGSYEWGRCCIFRIFDAKWCETCHAKYQFRANFLDIINITLCVTKYTDAKTPGSHVSGIYTLPTSWIVKVEDLTDIVHKNDICLPDDVLLEIDGFV